MIDEFTAISSAKFEKRQDYWDFAEFIINCWNDHYGRATLTRQGTLTLITGGWSNNESVYSALDCNRTFNMVCWESSHRGGKYVYKLPRVDKKTK